LEVASYFLRVLSSPDPALSCHERDTGAVGSKYHVWPRKLTLHTHKNTIVGLSTTASTVLPNILYA
jgi:hypothetical protein